MGDADGRRTLGAEHLAPACTTHFSVVDKHGNMAAVTQTLLSTFGSKFVTPNTGITMNNGIMWFDPTPGVPNSLAAGKRCLTNYTPVVAETSSGHRLAVGASGGRRILPAVTQLLSFAMDFRHESRQCDPPAAHRCQRRRDRDRRQASRRADPRRAARALRLRRGAHPDFSDEVCLPQRYHAPGHHQFRRDGSAQPWGDAVAEG
jgi:gamma-glutamyltranspeptidase/glutathione hydrolase